MTVTLTPSTLIIHFGMRRGRWCAWGVAEHPNDRNTLQAGWGGGGGGDGVEVGPLGGSIQTASSSGTFSFGQGMVSMPFTELHKSGTEQGPDRLCRINTQGS